MNVTKQKIVIGAAAGLALMIVTIAVLVQYDALGDTVKLGAGFIALIAIIGISVALYFVPTYVAMYRQKSNIGGVFIVNLVLGWVFIGWIVALIMACSADPQPKAVRA